MFLFVKNIVYELTPKLFDYPKDYNLKNREEYNQP